MAEEDVVYHYTDYQALLGIVDKNNGNLLFRASRYDSMNDPSDCQFTREIVMPIAIRSWQRDNPEIKDKVWDYSAKSYPYIISFSENGDDDSMWSHYHGQVCLILSKQGIKSSTHKRNATIATWGKCHYALPTDKESDIAQLVTELYNREIIRCNDTLMDLQDACSLVKRAAFEREREWRLIINTYESFTILTSQNNEIIEGEETVFTKFRCNAKGDIVTFHEHLLPKGTLCGLIVNETNPYRFSHVKKIIDLLLHKNGIYHVPVIRTNRYPL